MEIRAISSAAALRVAAVVLGLIITLRFLWIAHAIFIVTFLGVLLGLAMSRAVDYLERAKIRRGLGAAIMLIAVVGALFGLAALIGPSISRQSKEIGSELPKALDQVERWILRSPARALVAPADGGAAQPAAGGGAEGSGAQQQRKETPDTQPPPSGSEPAKNAGSKPPGKPGEQQQDGGGALSSRLAGEARGATRFLFPIVSSVFGAIGGFVIVLFIAMYVAAEPKVYRAGLMHLIPHRHRHKADDYLDTLGTTLRQWLIARLIAMVLIGVITGTGLALLQVKGAIALGVLAGLLEFVPFFGPIASAIPAIGIALVDSPQKAAYVLVLYLIIQQLEGNVITPLLLEKRLDIPPVLTVVVVAALGVVFGIIGMLVAEPLLAVILVTIKMLYVNNVVGDDVPVGKEG